MLQVSTYTFTYLMGGWRTFNIYFIIVISLFFLFFNFLLFIDGCSISFKLFFNFQRHVHIFLLLFWSLCHKLNNNDCYYKKKLKYITIYVPAFLNFNKFPLIFICDMFTKKIIVYFLDFLIFFYIFLL